MRRCSVHTWCSQTSFYDEDGECHFMGTTIKESSERLTSPTVPSQAQQIHTAPSRGKIYESRESYHPQVVARTSWCFKQFNHTDHQKSYRNQNWHQTLCFWWVRRCSKSSCCSYIRYRYIGMERSRSTRTLTIPWCVDSQIIIHLPF